MRDGESPLETTVRLAVTPVPDGEPQEVWIFVVDGPVDLGDIRRLYTPSDGLAPHSILEKRYVDYDWGASSEAVEILVQIASDVSVEMIMVGLGVIAKKVRDQFVDGGEVIRPIGRDAANSRAEHAIILTYKTASHESLRIVQESQTTDPLTYSFEYKDDHYTYEASVTQTPSGIVISRIARKVDPTPN